MSYLLTQIFLCLLVAALIGFIAGWLFKKIECENRQNFSQPSNQDYDTSNALDKSKESQSNTSQTDSTPSQKSLKFANAINEVKEKLEKESKLTLLKAPKNGQKDNLQLIKGIGPVLENMLNEIGIYHFDQIAALTPEDIEFINKKLAFSGRIERDDWIAQAKILAQGIDTEFSKKVKAGKVPTSKSKK